MNTLSDPKIRLDKAIAAFGGKKAGLARALGIERATVSGWGKDSESVYLPPIQAYRLLRNYPGLVEDESMSDHA